MHLYSHWLLDQDLTFTPSYHQLAGRMLCRRELFFFVTINAELKIWGSLVRNAKTWNITRNLPTKIGKILATSTGRCVFFGIDCSGQVLAKEISGNHTIVANHPKSLMFTHKHEAWIPHAVSKSSKNYDLTLRQYRASRGPNDRFLYKIVAGEYKWCLYVNMNYRSEWVAPREKRKPRA